MDTAFWVLQSIINGITYPAGILLVVWKVRPVARALGRKKPSPAISSSDDGRGTSPSYEALPTPAERAVHEEWADIRRRCLGLGHTTALISVSAWFIAGIAFPAGLALMGSLPLSAVFHFLGSLAVCGLIAAVYPFFAVTLIAVRAFYPHLFVPKTEDKTFPELRRRLNIYLVLVATVPSFGIMVLVLVGSTGRIALAAISVIGIIGFGLAFLSHRALNADLDAYDDARRSVREIINADERRR